MRIEKQATCKYEDKYHIFNVRVDIESLHDTILSDFLPSLTQKNFWFAVWYILKENNCLAMDANRSDFSRQMQEWYGKSYSKSSLDAYAATSLSYTKWTQWDDDFYQKFEEREKQAIKKKRISVSTARKMRTLCEQFDPIVKEKCFKQQLC